MDQITPTKRNQQIALDKAMLFLDTIGKAEATLKRPVDKATETERKLAEVSLATARAALSELIMSEHIALRMTKMGREIIQAYHDALLLKFEKEREGKGRTEEQRRAASAKKAAKLEKERQIAKAKAEANRSQGRYSGEKKASKPAMGGKK